MNPWISGVAILGLTLAGCIPAGKGSRLKVLGGLETSENVSVVLIENDRGQKCTGTFVARNVILTAGHCDGGMKYFGRAPVKDIGHPQYPKDGFKTKEDVRFDLRVLIFNKPLSKSFVNISSVTPSVGDSARIIGYGCNQIDTSTGDSYSGAGRKRAGDIRIDFVSSGILQSTKNDVAACFGDSGGPLLNKQGEIVGVASAITWGDKYNSYWADVNAPENKQFISAAMSQAGDPSQGGDDQNNENPGDNPTNNPPSDGGQPNPPSDSTVIDCLRDYSKIRAGGSGVCINRSSGFCYRYGSGDVLYDLGKASCSGGQGGSGGVQGDPSPGDNGGSSPLPPSPVPPSPAPPSPPSGVLDCNKDYLQIIHSNSSGVCLNRSSGFCYKYSGGDVRYDEGRVSCPGN